MVKQGDIIKINFNPQKGHEQAGYRPAVVISNRVLNRYKVFAFVCPITHTQKKLPFSYTLNDYSDIDGTVLCDQIRSLNLSSRPYDYVTSLQDKDIDAILERINMLMEKE